MKRLRWLVLLPAVFASLPVLGQETQPKAGEPAKEKRKRVQTNMAGFELLAADKLKQQTTVVGATRSLSPAPAVPLAPYLGQTSTREGVSDTGGEPAEVVGLPLYLATALGLPDVPE